MKVVINKCFGGFGLSPEATLRLHALGCEGMATPVAEYYTDPTDESCMGLKTNLQNWRDYLAKKSERASLFLTVFTPDETAVLHAPYGNDFRTNPLLIQVVEEMGKAANGRCADLAVVEIPDGTSYEISEYDGNEHIAETHRTWG